RRHHREARVLDRTLSYHIPQSTRIELFVPFELAVHNPRRSRADRRLRLKSHTPQEVARLNLRPALGLTRILRSVQPNCTSNTSHSEPGTPLADSIHLQVAC